MKRRKQSNRAMLEKHQQEYQDNLDRIARLTARNEELKPIIREEEDMEIVALVRSTRMGLDEFQRFLEGRRNGGVPFPMNQGGAFAPTNESKCLHLPSVASAEFASEMADKDEEGMTHEDE